MLQEDTVCNISDLWLDLESQSPRPWARLHLHVHFAGQIDKKTPKCNTARCSVSLLGPTNKNLEMIEKATYLIY